MNFDYWPIILSNALLGLFTALLVWWDARSYFKKRLTLKDNEVQHPRSTLILRSFHFLFFSGLATLTIVFRSYLAWWVSGIAMGLVVISLFPILDYFRARHELTPSGIYCGRLFLPRLHLTWKEVRSVTYSPHLRWFKIETIRGGVGRISVMLIGLPEFAQAVLTSVPPRAIAPDTFQILEANPDQSPMESRER